MRFNGGPGGSSFTGALQEVQGQGADTFYVTDGEARTYFLQAARNVHDFNRLIDVLH